VQGTVKISGGGNEGGICISDSTLGVVLVKGSALHPVCIRAEENTSVAVLDIQSPVCVEERGNTSGFNKLLIELDKDTQAQSVVLKGSFEDITVKSSARIELQRGDVRVLNFEATAQGSKMQLAYGTNIKDLSVDADNSLIQGEGTIRERRINGKNVIIDLKTGSGKKAKSGNNALSGIKVDGVTIDDFAPDTFNYHVSLPSGTGTIPTVTATAEHPQATVEVVQAEALPGTAVITVTAENGRVQNYFVHFSIGQSSESSEKEITSFKFAELDPEVVGVINEEEKTITLTALCIINEREKEITLTVPFDTDVTKLKPIIGVSEGASVSPASGVKQDFTNSVVYTVTAADESSVEYTVRGV
jgi:hypothetical protein